MSDRVKELRAARTDGKAEELAAAVAANPEHPLRAFADYVFGTLPPARRRHLDLFVYGDGERAVEAFTRLRTDEVQERLAAEEGE